MKKITVHIVDCPINSFKLTGENVEKYHDQALHKARDLYLQLHDEAYRQLMFKNFNALWTPDRNATNDIDPKDGFWTMYVFFFNTCLIKILSEKYVVEIIDDTGSQFRNQKHFYKFLKKEGIKIIISEKKRNSTSFKHSLKLFVIDSIQNTREALGNAINFFKEEFIESNTIPDISFEEESDKKIIYLAIPPVSNRNIEFYLGWRYTSIFEELNTFKKRGYRILLVGMRDYDKIDSFGFSLINVYQLVNKRERLGLFIKSFFYKIKVYLLVWSALLKASDSIKKYFLKNIPTDFYFALKENRAFNYLFKSFGSGLWIMKGPLVYKGISIRSFNARKNGVRSFTISGRVMTDTRLTNCFLKAHTDNQFPNVLPHSIYVSDIISFETIRNQTNKIDIYSTRMDDGTQQFDSFNNDFFSVTLVLQKRNEIESMVDTVLAAIHNFEDVILNLKPHPDFPIYDQLKEKYNKKQNVNIFSSDASLSEAIKRSDVCISCYSSAALDFAKNNKPIIWLNNVTLNSLLFKDVHEKMGAIVNNTEELEELILKMKDDPDFYQKMQKKHNRSYKKFINELDEEVDTSLTTVIEKELEKV